MILLKAEGVSKAYGKRAILEGIDLEIESGKLYALLGHNGAGKSTLMKVLMRKEGLDSGRGVVLGANFDSGNVRVNEEIAYVSEDVQFDLDLTVGELGSFFAKIYRGWDASRYESLCRSFHLSPNADPKRISRGQKMQLAFCVAIATSPKLLLVDEVTAVLDAGARMVALREVTALRDRGGAILIATNIVTDVQAFADEVLLLLGGKIVLRGSPAALAASFQKIRILHGDIGTAGVPSGARLVGVNSDRSFSFLIPKSGAASYAGTKAEIDRREITLEELFIYHTRGEA